MYKLIIKTSKDKTKIVSKLAGGTRVNVPEYEYLRTMRDFRIALPVSYNSTKLVYEIPYTMTLAQLFSLYLNEEIFFHIIAQFVQVVSQLTNSQMSVNNLLLDTNYIFIDPTGRNVMFIFQPLFNSGVQANVFYFLQSLTNQAILPAGESVSRMKRFRKFLSSQQYFNEEAFRDFLESKDDEREDRSTERMSGSRSDYGNSYDNRYGGSYGAAPAGSMFEREDRTVSIDDLVEDQIGTSVLGETAVLGSRSSAPSLERRKNGEKVLVDKPVFKIGSDRSRTDYWVSNNKAVSRVHAIITSDNGRYTIQDNKSTNFSYLNGSQLIPGRDYDLKSGDRIILADEEFVFDIR